MAELVLGPLLRFVSQTAATIWVETDAACTVEVLDRSTPTFCVAGHYYALVIVEGLEPATTIDYQVRLDGAIRWPLAGSTLPASRIRTLGREGPARMIFGSCRTAAPHEPPWTLQLEFDWRGRGVDALRTYALSMVDRPSEEWPEIAIFLGDQVYADDSSPRARERIAAQREQASRAGVDSAALPPPELVGGFEQFTWLYHESWSPEMERWFLANVPSVMIFDDHEMVDDWNSSDSWKHAISDKPWWPDHLAAGLMTYWLYQHLGNLSPETIRAEGVLDELSGRADGEEFLRAWAEGVAELARPTAEPHTHRASSYRFSFYRDVGGVRLVMVDCRNARILEPGQRRMIESAEWDWIVDACRAEVDHLLIGTSLPVFVPMGLHDMQVWSEAICDGAWGRVGCKVGEWLRIKADMEDWAAFVHSFDDFVDLLTALADPPDGLAAPATISVLSGDIHFAYAAEVRFPGSRRPGHEQLTSRVHQLVSSPIRNALRPPESTAMRLGVSRFSQLLGQALRRGARRPRARLAWEVDLGPVFANSVGELTFDGRGASLMMLQARPHSEDEPPGFDQAFELDLVAGSRATALGSGAARRSSSRTPRRRQTRYRPPRR